MEYQSLIQNSMEFIYEGVYPNTYKPVLVPYCLRTMKAGVTASDLVESLFEVAGLFINMKKNAFENISRYMPNYNNTTPTPPSYFKLDTVMEVTSVQIDIKMSKNLLVGNCGDRVRVNSNATC